MDELWTEEEVIGRYGDAWQDCVSGVDVQTTDGIITYYHAKPTRKRLRSSLSSVTPTQKLLLQAQKDLRNEIDLHRKLNLLSQYQEKEEYEKVDKLIEKWEGIIREAVDALWSEAQSRTGVTFEQFVAALQLGGRIERLVRFDDDNVSEDDQSVLECLMDDTCSI